MTDETATLSIEPLTSDRFPALADLFEEGGDPKWCWCTYFRVRGRDWTNASPADNRLELETLAAKDPAPGLLALRDERAIGWVSLGPRVDLDRLAHSKLYAPIDDRPVWSIVCFVVSRRARGAGVATALLAAAIDYAKANGATTLEAYPVDPANGRLPAAEAYRGTLGMFGRAGFSVVARRQWNASTPVRPIGRLDLATPVGRPPRRRSGS